MKHYLLFWNDNKIAKEKTNEQAFCNTEYKPKSTTNMLQARVTKLPSLHYTQNMQPLQKHIKANIKQKENCVDDTRYRNSDY